MPACLCVCRRSASQKNRELEKFKSVLDYKIKKLCRQMEPRENELKRMKGQIEKGLCM